ncbi:hypothetical protein [Devosia sp. Root635]|uniref:hypothetical protein n=1 Tax=Devosia sp. Root635 TaxID=1736575 RepID=UPI0007016B8B|nr:hypothetical protein [Devosia sp. Root635]KRA40171.1 hypothetical protein ASD80_12200 [Devosia sp. Root635]
MVEPRSADEGVLATLSRAKALIESHDFDSAVQVYFQLLKTELSGPLRGEVLTNLGAALCLLGRSETGPLAQARLDQAHHLLVSALPFRSRIQAPAAWATTRANLAMVHLARYQAGGDRDELLSGHLALDGIEQALSHTGETALRDWATAIRDQLIDLRERRRERR